MWSLGYWMHQRLEGVLFQPVASVLFWVGKQVQRHLAFHSTLYNLLPSRAATNMHEVTFEWPHPEPSTIIVTGTFDQWSSSIHLTKDRSGFKGSTQIPWAEKIAYKFIVDGEWSIAPSQPTETDDSGNVNNIYTAPSLPTTTTMAEKPVANGDSLESSDKQGTESAGGVSQVVSDLAAAATAGTAAGLGYVTSGVGAAIQTVVGEDPEKITAAPEQAVSEPTEPAVEETSAVVSAPTPPIEESPAAPEPEPTPQEPTPAPVPLAAVTPIFPIAIVPVNAAENNESPPPSAETKEEASTHRPSSFSSTPVVPPATTEVSPVPVEVPPAAAEVVSAPAEVPSAPVEVPPAPVEVLPELSPAPVEVPPAPVEVPPTPVEASPAPAEIPPPPIEVSPTPATEPAVAPTLSDVIDDKKSIPETPPTNGPVAAAESQPPQLATPPPSVPSTPKKKEAFPSTDSPTASPASSSRFGSARKKRSSIFGKINIKHIFSPSKDKDKEKK